MIYIFRRGYNGHNDSLSSTQAKRLFRATQDHRSDSSKLKGVLMNQQQLTTVGILIFDDVEVLDFCGPFEVFSVARPPGENSDDARLFHVITIAEEDKIIRCRGGLLVKPHYTIDNHPTPRYPARSRWTGHTPRKAQYSPARLDYATRPAHSPDDQRLYRSIPARRTRPSRPAPGNYP